METAQEMKNVTSAGMIMLMMINYIGVVNENRANFSNTFWVCGFQGRAVKTHEGKTGMEGKATRRIQQTA